MSRLWALPSYLEAWPLSALGARVVGGAPLASQTTHEAWPLANVDAVAVGGAVANPTRNLGSSALFGVMDAIGVGGGVVGSPNDLGSLALWRARALHPFTIASMEAEKQVSKVSCRATAATHSTIAPIGAEAQAFQAL